MFGDSLRGNHIVLKVIAGTRASYINFNLILYVLLADAS